MNLLKSLAAVSSMTLLSRVLGFVRDTIVARAFGAGMAIDPAEPGFEEHLKSMNDGLGADACLEITGANAAFEAALKSLRTGGTLVLVGAVYPAGPVAISQEDIVWRMLTIKGLHNYAPVDLASAVNFLQKRSKFEPAIWADLFGPEFPLDEVAAAFAWLPKILEFVR